MASEVRRTTPVRGEVTTAGGTASGELPAPTGAGVRPRTYRSRRTRGAGSRASASPQTSIRTPVRRFPRWEAVWTITEIMAQRKTSSAALQVDFVVLGVGYTIQANLKTSRGDRAALIQAAQAAIAAGPR
jgi:hypothetical protein